MHFLHLTLLLTTLLSTALAAPLVSFHASANDDPKQIGILDLEQARSHKQSANSNDLYVKLDKDPKGTPALHYHRKEGDIRAEYHALPGKTEKDKTYYIGYKFSLGEVEKSLMIWQFKEYEADTHGGANIPLSLELGSDGIVQFQHQPAGGKREMQWQKQLTANTVYAAGIVINTSTPGWVQLYWDGEAQELGSKNETKLDGITTFPGRADPKFGAYRGEAVGIDTFVYDIVVSESEDDIKDVAGIK